MIYDSEFHDGMFIHVVFTIVTLTIPLSLFPPPFPSLTSLLYTIMYFHVCETHCFN